MKTGTWALALVVAVGFVLVAAEVSPAAVNWILLLVLVGIFLARWQDVRPLAVLLGGAAGERKTSGAKLAKGA